MSIDNTASFVLLDAWHLGMKNLRSERLTPLKPERS
jgi:hypothetical protein